MLHLIPAPLHRVLYRIADRLRRRWWGVRRPRRSSVSVVAFDGEGRVLLVRHSYGPPVWTLPAGGMRRGEAPEQAVMREFREELSCGLSDLTELEAKVQDTSGSIDLLHLYAARVAGEPQVDMREVVEAGFFDHDALPRPLDRRVEHRVGLARGAL